MTEGSSNPQPLVLLVEDEEVVATMTTAMLEALGYRVTHCSSAAEAEMVYTAEYRDISLVILDMLLPDATGSEIFQKLEHINPEVKCLIASGYSQDENIQALIDKGAKGFIQKPFKLAQLSEKLGDLFS